MGIVQLKKVCLGIEPAMSWRLNRVETVKEMS